MFSISFKRIFFVFNSYYEKSLRELVGIEESGINYSTPKISERGDLISKAKEMLHPKFK